MKSQKEMQDIQPELKKIQKKHKDDKEALQKAQLELYKKYNVNPLSGCIPQIVQLGLLIVLYQVFITFLNGASGDASFNHVFLWINLTAADKTYVLPVLAAVSQFLYSLMVLPGGEVVDLVPNKSKNKAIKKANEKEEDTAEMAASMQKQMIFMMPILTLMFASSFPAGLVLYWIVTTVFSMVQQGFVSGWGGLKTYPQRAWNMVQTRFLRN